MKILLSVLIYGILIISLANCSPNKDSANLSPGKYDDSKNTNSGVADTNQVSNNSGTMNSNNQSSNSNTSNPDPGFLANAAEGGMAEVELGKLAASKATTPEVKAFGAKMVADHTKANAELMELASSQKISLPPNTNPIQKANFERLSKLSGTEFDRKYVNIQVEDHEKTIALFQREADQGNIQELKMFAAKTLPTLKMHLEMVKSLSGKIK